MSTRNHFAVGVTLYNPIPQYIEWVNRYVDVFDYVFVFDNSEQKNDTVLSGLSKSKNVIYIKGKGNEGLPGAYNGILDHPLLNNVDYLCEMDQDSDYPKEEIIKIRDYIEKNDSEIKETVGVIGPYIDYGTGNKWVSSEIVSEKKYVITSGCFVNLSIVRKEKMRYDPNYFVDKFEPDFCMQMIRKGYKVLMYYGAYLRQRLGEETWSKKHSSHNSQRTYYLFRNRLYFNHKWYLPPKRWILNILQTGRNLYYIIVFGDKKIEKLRLLPLAIHDYHHRIMGKRDI